MRELHIGGLIFDMDGTLTDSMYIWDDASIAYLRSKGFAELPHLLEDISGITTLRQFAQYAHTAYLPDLTVDEIYAEYELQIRSIYAREIGLKPGIEMLLRELRRRKVRMAIATGNDPELARICMKRCGVEDCFSCIISVNDVGRDKDFPDVYDACREHMRTTPEETWVAEDSPYAMATAKKAGYHVIGAPDDFWKGHMPDPLAAADITMSAFMKRFNIC